MIAEYSPAYVSLLSTAKEPMINGFRLPHGGVIRSLSRRVLESASNLPYESNHANGEEKGESTVPGALVPLETIHLGH